MASGTQVGSIYYDLDLDSKKFDSGVSSAKAKAKSLGSDLSSYFGKATQASKTFAGALTGVATALAGGIGYGLKVAGDLEAAEQGFKALLGSSEKAGDTMARIKKEAKATPFELTGLVAGTQALTAITKDGNKAVDILLDVGKAIAISGKGQAEMDRVILNLQQIASTGKITAMDIRQFQGAIPIFNDILAANGLTVEALQESENAAELLFEAFKKAGQEGGITARGFIEQSGTFNQLLSNVKDSLTIFGSEFVKQTGIFDLVKEAMAGVIVFIETRALPIITDVFNWIKDNFPLVAGIITGALTPALLSIAGAFLMNLLYLAPFIALGALLFYTWSNNKPLFWGLVAAIGTLAVIIGITMIPTLISLAGAGWAAIAPWLPFIAIAALVGAAVYVLIKYWNEISGAMKIAWEWVGKLWDKFANSSPVRKIVDDFNSLIGTLKTVWDWLSKIWDKVSGFASGAISKIKGLFGGERADGGYVQRGITYLVGERGPELFTPSGSGNIIPNKELGGSVNKSINVNINPGFLIGTPSEARELGRIAYNEIKRLETAGAI